MVQKPKMFGENYAVRFNDQSIVDAYHLRPPYADEVFDVLEGLIVDEPKTVLDVGCGTGDIARKLVDRAEHVDAVDFSEGMIEKGRRSPNGDNPNLRWIHSRVEDAGLTPPYALITAGDCIGWFDWNTVFTTLHHVLSPKGVLAVVSRSFRSGDQMREKEIDIIRRYSTNKDWVPFDVVAGLEERGLLKVLGQVSTKPLSWRPTIDEYIEMTHSQQSFSRDQMGSERAIAHDAELRKLLVRLWGENGYVDHETFTTITWGRPLRHES